ncbi:MAG TPA: translocation/assembly module TamB domain-containing protein [Terriglobales bacterium]|nr:translocation/assembly module TamB domain-containing protein [Terriglobales bacterium]
MIVAAGLLLLVSALAWYATTPSFQLVVRNRLVAELQRVTGGRVELGGFHTVPFRFEVDVRDLTIHGREVPGDVPYFHVDRLVARVKLISALGAEFGFHSVVLDRPVVHIITYFDGTTNQPAPTPATVDARAQIERLFSFSIGRLEVRQGALLWNDHKLPLDFAANNVAATLDYSLLHRRYDGNLRVGKVDTNFDGYRPVAWTGEAQFELSSDSLVVISANASSGRSQFAVRGRMVDFSNPSVVGEYDVTVDLAEAGSVARRREMRSGTLHAVGRGSWSKAAFSTSGKLQGNDLDWHTESLRLQHTSLSSQFTVNPQRIMLTDLYAKVLGGEVSGDAQVLNWQSSPTPPGTARGNEQQRGSVRLQSKNLSAQAVATALSSTARPLYRVNPAGSISGSLETQWRGSPQSSESRVRLTVVAPDSVQPDQLPVNAYIVASYRAAAGELEVSEFKANTRASQISASGTLSNRAAVNFSVATSNFEEWEQVLEALGYQERSPFSLRGRASLAGRATGKLSEIAIAGKLQSQDFEMVTPASPSAARRNIRWDSLAGDIQLSPHAFAMHNAFLRRGKAVIHFDVDAGLDQRQFTDSSPFKARLQMHDADVPELLDIVGYKYPVTGSLNLSMRASGTRASPLGEGAFQLSGATIRGEAIRQINFRFNLNQQQISLQDIQIAHGAGRVTGNGSYEFAGRAFDFKFAGSNFDLASIATLQSSRVPVKGEMDFVAQAAGTPEQPVMNAQIHLHDLTFGDERAGDYILDAVTKGSELQLSGHSQFPDKDLTIEGKVNLQGNWPAKLDCRFSRLDVDPLLTAYLRGRVTGHSAVTGDLHLVGPLRNPGELRVTGNLDDFFADLEHIQVHNNDPIRFEASEQTLRIQRLRLIGEGTDLEIGGSVQLTGEHSLNLNAEGHADLRLIHSLYPDFNSSGTVAVSLIANGTAQQPNLQGHLQVSRGTIQYGDLPSALSDLSGSLIFNQNRLQIESLTGQIGGGQLSFAGYAIIYNRQLNFDLTLHAQDTRLRYPPGISSMSTSTLRWSGTSTASTLTGDATITKLAVTPGFDFSSYLQSRAQSSAMPQTNPSLNRIRLDVRINTTPQLQMQTAALTLSGDADLHLRGTAAKPVLLGRVDILEGQIAFNGTKYRLERGDINFTNPVTTTPVLDLQAATRLREYEITVNLNGEFDKLNLTYHSEPPLATADIISLLSPIGSTQQFGQVQQQTAPSPFAQQASSAVLSEALNSALSNRSQRLFGISHIKIDPQGLNTETAPTQTSPLPAVTIEQPVRDNVTLTYTTNLAQTSQQIIQGEYNITSRVSIVGVRDYNGVVSFEIRFRRTKN